MTVQTAVQKIADDMAEAEKQANKTLKAMRQLRAQFKEVSDGTPGTSLVTAKYHAALVTSATVFAADLLAIHYELTEQAKAFGIDIPSAPPSDDEIGIFSGGGR